MECYLSQREIRVMYFPSLLWHYIRILTSYEFGTTIHPALIENSRMVLYFIFFSADTLIWHQNYPKNDKLQVESSFKLNYSVRDSKFWIWVINLFGRTTLHIYISVVDHQSWTHLRASGLPYSTKSSHKSVSNFHHVAS